LPVEFRGFEKDLSLLYKQVDALVVPSRGPEGSCLVALEAMAYGLPCIMSDLPVYQEISDRGAAALLFPVGDSGELANAIRHCVNDNTLRGRLASHAYSMVQSRYSTDAAKSAYLQAFGVGL
jgi:glycosyltransferase involved in cell wall biosynthesis